MQEIKKWLNQPYPYKGAWRDTFKDMLVIGLFVTFFLMLFKPFGIRYSDGHFWDFVLMCSAFGLVTAFVMLIFTAVTMNFSGFFNEESWVVWKEVLANIVMILLVGTANIPATVIAATACALLASCTTRGRKPAV